MIRRPPSSTLFPYPTLSRSHIEIVLQAARRQHSRERADRQVSSCPGQIGAHDDMATAAPRRRKLEIGAVTTVKRAPVHERSEAQGTARVHEVPELEIGRAHV